MTSVQNSVTDSSVSIKQADMNSYSADTMKDSSTSGVEQNTVRPRLPMPTASTGTQEAARSILNAEEGKPACNYTRTGHLATGDLNLPDNPPVEPSTLKRAAPLTTQTSQPQDGFFNILKCSLTRKKARTMTSTSTGSLPPPAATPAPGKYRPPHDFRDPLEIPFHGKKILVYRHADAHISQEHHRRFPDILELFRQQIQRDKNLSASSQANTEYKLKMCGVNPEDSHASILILHPLEYFEQGKCILKSLSARTLENQYNNKKMGPIFKLYLFLSEGSQMLGNSMNSLSIHMDKENLLGAQLVSNDERYQTSTITCGVQFDGNDTVFALTTAHAFEDNDAEESDKPAWNPDDTIPNYSGSESDDICDRGPSNTVYECDTCDDGPLYTLDDYDWERIEKEAITAKEDREPSLDNPKKPDSSNQKVERHPSCFEIAPGQVWGRPNDPKWAVKPNLDWALVEIPTRYVLVEEDEITSDDLPKTSAMVVVSTRSGFHEGTLSNIPSYISRSGNLTPWTKIWTITLENKQESNLRIGDSGSPVLNQARNRVYGYVTALNYFEELHVMPLQPVLNQIAEMVQPLKATVITRVRENSENQMAKSAQESVVSDRLLRYWPKEPAVVPDMDPQPLTLPSLKNASDDLLVLRNLARRLNSGHRVFFHERAIRELSKQSPLPGDILETVAAVLRNKKKDIRASAITILCKQATLLDNILDTFPEWLENKDNLAEVTDIEILSEHPVLPSKILEVIAAKLDDQDNFVQAVAVEILGKRSVLQEYPITEAIMKAATANGRSGKRLVTLLLDRRGADIPITEAVVIAAASNNSSGKDVMAALLDRCGVDIPITEAVIEAAAANDGSGPEVIKALLRWRESDIRITEAVVKAAARNTCQTVMTVLLDWRGEEVIEVLENIRASDEIEIRGPRLFRVKSARKWNYHALRKGVFKTS